MKILEYTVGYPFIAAMALGWMDTLWLFGVEDSARYTWWSVVDLILEMRNGW